MYLFTLPEYLSNNGGIKWSRANSGLGEDSYYQLFYQDLSTTELLYNFRTDSLYSSSYNTIYGRTIKGTESLLIYFNPSGFYYRDVNMKNIFIEAAKKELFLGTAESIYKTSATTDVYHESSNYDFIFYLY